MKRIKLHIIVLFLMLLSASYAQTTEEYTLKAVYLEMLTRWIDWPGMNSFDDSNVFVLGIIGDSPFGNKLDRMYATQKIKGKKVKIKYIDSVAGCSDCHMLFICSSESNRLKSILEAARNKGILTISDTEGFAQKGVLINLYKSGKNIKFEINKKELIDSGFTVSPYLLSLAKIVNFMGGGL